MEAERVQPQTASRGRWARVAPGNSSRRNGRILYISAIALALGILFSFVAIRNISGTSAEAPGLIGLRPRNAEQALTRAGLRWNYGATIASRSVPLGRVAAESPTGGSNVGKGSTVVLHISAGPMKVHVTIPGDLIDESFVQAQSELSGLGLKVARQDIPSNDVDSGNVVRSSPNPGQRVDAGDTATLFVSNGSPDIFGDNGRITVPSDLKGEKIKDAQRELRALGLKTNVVGREDGIVHLVSPSEGTAASKGATITLWAIDG